MAYGFNEDKSKVEIYSADQIDAMDLMNDEALQQEANTRAFADTALSNQIANIVAPTPYPDGTTVDELINIRSGYDGTEGPSAGSVVRSSDKKNQAFTSDVKNLVAEFFGESFIKKISRNGSLYNNMNCAPGSDNIGVCAYLSQLNNYISAEFYIYDDCYIGFDLANDFKIDNIEGNQHNLSYYSMTVVQGASDFNWVPNADNTAYSLYGSTVNRYRLSDNNLPTESNPLLVQKGTLIIVSMSNNIPEISPFLKIKSVNSDRYIGISDTDFIQEHCLETNVLTLASPDVTVLSNAYANKYSSASIGCPTNNNYACKYVVVDKKSVVYALPLVNGNIHSAYNSICVLRKWNGRNTVGNSGEKIFEGWSADRYRNADNNMPTKDNPIYLDEGDVVVLQHHVSSSEFKVMTNLFDNDGKYELFDLLIYKSQIVDLDDVNYYPYGYVETNNVDSISIHMKSGNGYSIWPLVHYVNDSINANTWRINVPSVTNLDRTQSMNVCNAGELECALKIYNRDDFIGGANHGDEITNSIDFWVDGKHLSIENIIDGVFDEFKCVTISTLYDPADHSTAVATHMKEYVFSNGKLLLRQKVLWLHNETMDTSYLCMFPVLRSLSMDDTGTNVTNKAYCDDDYVQYDASISGLTNHVFMKRDGVKFCSTYGTDSGVECTTRQIKQLINNVDHPGKFQVSNAIQYNKHYWSISQLNDQVVAGDVWETEYEYEIHSNR